MKVDCGVVLREGVREGHALGAEPARGPGEFRYVLSMVFEVCEAQR